MDCSTPALPVLEFTQTHVHRVGDALQPSHQSDPRQVKTPNPEATRHPQSLHSLCAALQGTPADPSPGPPLSCVLCTGGDCVSLTSSPHRLQHPWNIGLCIEERNHIKCESVDSWGSGRGKRLESSLSHKRKRPEQSNFK